MTNFAKALQQFFEGFGLPVYAKDDVPDGAQLPYITYELVAPAPLARAKMRAWIWHRAEGRVEALGVLDDLESALSEGGVAIGYDGGCGYLNRDGEGEVTEVGGEVRGYEVRMRVES